MHWGSWKLERVAGEDTLYAPRKLKGPRISLRIMSGLRFNALISHDGCVWMWGMNTEGQLGRPSTSIRDSSRAIQVFVDAGSDKINVGCRVRFSRGGVNGSGRVVLCSIRDCTVELDDGKTSEVSLRGCTPMAPLRVRDVACGGTHTVALSAHGLYIWGDQKAPPQQSRKPRTHRPSHSNSPSTLYPQKVPTTVPVFDIVSISAGLRHSAFTTKTCHVFAWGHAGAFRFTNPLSSSVEMYSHARVPEVLQESLQSSPGVLSEAQPCLVSGWETGNTANRPVGVTVQSSFSKAMSVTVISADFGICQQVPVPGRDGRPRET